MKDRREGDEWALFNEYPVSFWDDEKLLEMDCGDVSVIMWKYLMLLSCMVKMENFMLRNFTIIEQEDLKKKVCWGIKEVCLAKMVLNCKGVPTKASAYSTGSSGLRKSLQNWPILRTRAGISIPSTFWQTWGRGASIKVAHTWMRLLCPSREGLNWELSATNIPNSWGQVSLSFREDWATNHTAHYSPHYWVPYLTRHRNSGIALHILLALCPCSRRHPRYMVVGTLVNGWELP